MLQGDLPEPEVCKLDTKHSLADPTIRVVQRVNLLVIFVIHRTS